MENTMKGGIKKYCQEHKLSMTDLAEIVGISAMHLYTYDKTPMYPATVLTLTQIYQRTREKFGIGLSPDMFLDFEILHKKTGDNSGL